MLNRFTPEDLIKAARDNDVTFLYDEYLEHYDYKKHAVNVKSSLGWTALLEASTAGHVEFVRCLIRQGADVNTADTFGNTPLQAAATQGHLDVLQVLLASGAKVNKAMANGQTPLHVLAWKGHIRDKNLYPLISLFTDPDCTERLIEVLRFLLENDACLEAIDIDGNTPLHKAAQFGYWHAAEVFLDHGAAIDVRNHEGATPLHLAVQRLKVQTFFNPPNDNALLFNVIKNLVARGVNVDAVMNDGTTALQLAVRNKASDVSKFLLDHHADVNKVRRDRTSALHIAAYTNQKEMVKLLLDHGADVRLTVTCEDGPDLSAYWIAVLHRHNEVADMIQRKHSPVTADTKQSYYSLPSLSGIVASGLAYFGYAQPSANQEDDQRHVRSMTNRRK